jgi:hypothetical protein
MDVLKILSFVIRDKYKKLHTLRYALYNTPLANKYVAALDANVAIANNNIDSNFNNKVEADYPDICNEIKALVKSINQSCDYLTLPEYDTIQQKELNNLHELFEDWGAVPRQQEDRSLAHKFFKLNDLIHMCEDTFMDGRVMGAIVDVKPSIESGKGCKHFRVTEKDKLLLTDQYNWGRLYLGYNTLGKDYLAAMKDNDIRLIQNDQVKPQVRYAAEVWLNFGPDQHLPTKFEFAKWLDTLDEKTSSKINLNDVQGRLLLGELIIDKPVGFDKVKWNKEVFSTFREVVDVIITEQWPPQELADFIKENKHQQWIPDELPANVWKSDWPWAPVYHYLNNPLNERRVKEELARIDKHFTSHRDTDKSGGYGHEGWSGVTLHGIGPTKTENFEQYGYKTQEEANYHWTSICKECPYIVSTIKTLPFNKFDRVRIMKLDPGGYIMPHKDGDGRIFGPLNIALTNPEGCEFIFEGKGVVPFEPGRGFMLDLGIRHCVLNATEEPRYHIIVHGTPSDDMGPLIWDSLQNMNVWNSDWPWAPAEL